MLPNSQLRIITPAINLISESPPQNLNQAIIVEKLPTSEAHLETPQQKRLLEHRSVTPQSDVCHSSKASLACKQNLLQSSNFQQTSVVSQVSNGSVDYRNLVPIFGIESKIKVKEHEKKKANVTAVSPTSSTPSHAAQL